MQVAHVAAAALRRASTADALEALQQRLEVLEATLRVLTGSDLMVDLVCLYPRLTPMTARILAMLLTRPIVTRDALFTTLYGDRRDPPEEHTIAVLLNHLRRRMPGTFKIVNHCGLGWSLRPDDKAAIRAAIAAHKEA